MTSYVIDASIVAVALLKEPGMERARAFLEQETSLSAPDLIFPELANVVWKRASRDELSSEEADRMLTHILRLPFEITRSTELLPRALTLACQTRRTVYDCLYLALAVRTNSVLVTADKRLVNSLARGPLARHIISLDKLPRSG